MDVESGMLLGAISALATVVVYLWKRIEASHAETRNELQACLERERERLGREDQDDDGE